MVVHEWIYRVVGRDSGIHIGDIQPGEFNDDEIEALYEMPVIPAKMLWQGKLWLVKRVTDDEESRMTIIEVFMYNDNPDLTKYKSMNSDKEL